MWQDKLIFLYIVLQISEISEKCTCISFHPPIPHISPTSDSKLFRVSHTRFQCTNGVKSVINANLNLTMNYNVQNGVSARPQIKHTNTNTTNYPRNFYVYLSCYKSGQTPEKLQNYKNATAVEDGVKKLKPKGFTIFS